MNTAIVLGGTADHIHLIRILKNRGFYVILCDYLDNPPAKQYADAYKQISILDKEAILEFASRKNTALVIATCIDQALETSAFVSEKLGLPCHINYQTSLTLTNKNSMKSIMTKNSISTSRYVILKESNDISKFDFFNYPLVIKPVDANSSKGVFLINTPEEILDFFDTSMSYSKTKEVIVEEFVEGKELSVDIFIENGKAEILMITENIKTKNNPKSFTIVESVYNRYIEDNLKESIKGIANKIIQAFGLTTGPLLLQCIYNEKQDKLSVIEFSNRVGGGSKYFFINRLKGVDIIDAFVGSVLGNKPELKEITPKYNFAKIKYLYTRKGIIEEYKGLENLKRNGTIIEYFIYKKPGSEVYESLKSSDRCIGLFYVSENEGELRKKEEVSSRQVKVIDRNGFDILLR